MWAIGGFLVVLPIVCDSGINGGFLASSMVMALGSGQWCGHWSSFFSSWWILLAMAARGNPSMDVFSRDLSL